MVRLRDDFAPVEGGYYLRTLAYSQLMGTKLVRAEARDADIAWSVPNQRIELPARPPRTFLRDLVATVFMIGDDNSVPGLVEAVVIEPQTNPSPSEFSGAFKVTSQVLVQEGPHNVYAELARSQAGDPRWDDATRTHYLAYPSDPRYRELALEITQLLTVSQRKSPLAKALAIRKWMEDNVVYDYNPKHDKAPDRTASFLFGDRHGYCVHFAHAMTYLLRALGVPARLAVGYRVSPERAGKRGAFVAYNTDRHAWAEIYLDQIGWIVMEASAKGRVAAADPEPDPRELDRFLSTIGEVPPEVLADDESKSRSISRLVRSGVPLAIVLALMALYAVKLWRGVRPRFVAASVLPRVGYRAVLDRLAEIGYRRNFGETWEEFCAPARRGRARAGRAHRDASAPRVPFRLCFPGPAVVGALFRRETPGCPQRARAAALAGIAQPVELAQSGLRAPT